MSYARNRRRRLIKKGMWHPALDHSGRGGKLFVAPIGTTDWQPLRGIRDLRFTEAAW
jgi:hypothetical protein